MSWIKLQTTLPRSPEVIILASALGLSRREALGLVVEYFCWLDEQTTDGCTALSASQLDLVLDRQGFAEALVSIGWMASDENGIMFVLDFDKHNGETAKKRALTARRVEKLRQCNAPSVTDALPREEYNINNTGGDSKRMTTMAQPPCQPTPPEFSAWLQALCAAHPSTAKARSLSAEVYSAALDAFNRYPDAANHADLLTAYFRSTQTKNSKGHTYWRPTGQVKFFTNLEDVLTHAELWKKENRWSNSTPKPDASAPQITTPEPPPMTEEERKEALETIKSLRTKKR